VVVNDGSLEVTRDADAFIDNDGSCYRVTKRIARPDGELFAAVESELQRCLSVRVGLNASSDSFYGSQGRRDVNFEDRNDGLVDKLKERQVLTMEMESFSLLHLANCSKGSIREYFLERTKTADIKTYRRVHGGDRMCEPRRRESDRCGDTSRTRAQGRRRNPQGHYEAPNPQLTLPNLLPSVRPLF
jgi:hypothetical protein